MLTRTRLTALMICLLTCTTVVHPGQSAPTQTTLRFACHLPPDYPLFQAVLELYQQALSPLGYQIEMIYLPTKRSLADANAGLFDGECGRTEGLDGDGPLKQMIRLPVLLMEGEAHVWALDAAIGPMSTEQLQRSEYRIGYVRGNVSYQRYLAQRPAHLVEPVLNAELGFRMLQAKRLDLLGVNQLELHPAIQPLAPGQHPRLVGTLGRIRGYPYLHQRHSALAPKLTEELTRVLRSDSNPLLPFVRAATGPQSRP